MSNPGTPVTLVSQLTADDDTLTGGGVELCVDTPDGPMGYHLRAGDVQPVVVIAGTTIKISLDSQNLDC